MCRSFDSLLMSKKRSSNVVTRSQKNNNKKMIRYNNDDEISSAEFYSEYHGHKVQHLKKLLPHLRQCNSDLIWTAGDSSLDNKYWFSTKAVAVGAYNHVLRPQESICDVTYWLNYLAKERFDDGSSGINYAAINTAGKLLTMSIFLMHKIKSSNNDIFLYFVVLSLS